MSNLQIQTAADNLSQEIESLIFDIQANEFKLAITIKNPPGFENISEDYQKDGGNFWVAIDNNKVVGTIGLKKISAHEAAIKRMYVKREYRGKPYQTAQKLLGTLIAFCEANHIYEIYLGTRAAYLAAHTFYEKNHFKEIQKSTLPTNFPIASVDTKFYKRKLSTKNIESIE